VDTIIIDLSDRNYLSKDEMMILDLLATNNWERPIYWAITVGHNKYMNLEELFSGGRFWLPSGAFERRILSDMLSLGTVATDIMYDNMMNNFEYGNMNDPDVYIDENNMRMMTNIRTSFNRLANGLVNEGKMDSAVAVIDRAFELIPGIACALRIFFGFTGWKLLCCRSCPEKGKQLYESFNQFDDELGYFLSLTGNSF
jgi:hypothetical protein